MNDIPEENDREYERAVRAELLDVLKEEGGDQFWRKLYEGEPLMVSQTKESERPAFLAVSWFAEAFEQEWLQKLIETDLKFRVSYQRTGRKEAIAAMTGNVEKKVRRILRLRRGSE